MMTGVNGNVGSPFNRRQTSMPSSLGIITSRSTRSGCVSCATVSASSPSPAVTTSCPSCTRRAWMMRTFVALSSTTRMRAGFLTGAQYSPRTACYPFAGVAEPVSDAGRLHATTDADPDRYTGEAGRFANLLLRRTPLGGLVRTVAAWPVSVHRKLLTAFLVVTVLFVAMGLMSIRTIGEMSKQTTALDRAHERVHWTQDMEHALAMQMHFTARAIVGDDTSISSILRENNRFNDTVARIANAAPSDEREIIQRIGTAQD